MTPDQLSRTVRHVVRRVLADGGLVRGGLADGALGAAGPVAVPERVTVECPPRRGTGDYALSVAFLLANAAGRAPREVAGVLRERLLAQPGIADVEIAGPGFLNVTLDGEARAALVRELAEPAQGAQPDAAQPAGPRLDVAQPDAPAADIAHWAAATGDDPRTLAVRDTSSSLFRVQYAHARARALLRNGRDLGCAPEAAPESAAPYGAPPARALLALLADHARHAAAPRTAHARKAHARHLEAVSEAFFAFHDAHAPLPHGDEKPGAAHRARLALAEAAGTVLARGLSQLGVTAPAHL